MRRPSRGFTLLELMVVMTLIGILLGMVGLATGNAPARLARQEASVLVQLLQALREQAVLEGREFGLHVEPQRYQVLSFDEGNWIATGRAYRLPDSLQLQLESPERTPHMGSRLVQPQLLVLSSDEYTPFTLHLQADRKTLASLSSDGLNEVALDD